MSEKQTPKTTKAELLSAIVATLNEKHQQAISAAQQAHDTATAEENIAENKYDTLGLEAAYLAQGHSERALSLESDIEVFTKLAPVGFSEDDPIAQGALVLIEDTKGEQQRIFLGPVSGGLKIRFKSEDIMLITTQAPLGSKLLGASVGDEVEVDIAGEKKVFDVVGLA